MAREEVCCCVCGSLKVQYVVWYSPNTDETEDLFGSWNAGDNTYCADCDAEGRDPNPNLLHRGEDPELFTKLRRKWTRRHPTVHDAV